MKSLEKKGGGGHLQQIKKIQKNRQERRVKMEEAKKIKEERKILNAQSGKNVDIDFQLMIEQNKFRQKLLSPHIPSNELKLAVCVRKRPIFKKQQQGGEIDSISCANPQIKIHEPKYKVDGITKYVENHTFTFDNTFNEEEQTTDIYVSALRPLLPLLTQQGIVTCFAYGQTGSGKTYTMNGLQEQLVQELFTLTKKHVVTVTNFEIYGGRCLDLLNQKAVLNIMEDKNGNIQIPGLTEKNADSAKGLLEIMEQANANRTTHATVANDTSSRSHAICQIYIKKTNQQFAGKLVLVDLAGSERAQDTQSNNRQRRIQGAEINKSLLALKECIRAMDDKADHVPFRASKLTLILRDSFLSKQLTSKIVMIACISPGSSSADHSLNTLRYSERLKDQTQLSKKYNQINENNRKNYESETKPEKQQRPQHKNNSIEMKKQVHKIESAGNIKKEESSLSKQASQNQKQVLQPKNSHNKMAPKVIKSANEKKEDPPVPREPPKEIHKDHREPPSKEHREPPSKDKETLNLRQKQKHSRVTSIRKPVVQAKPPVSKQKDWIEQQIQIEQAKAQKKKKVKQDINAMKRTMRGQNKQQFFAFQQKVTSVLQQQQQVFATHMAAIKQDAKLLTQQSELISAIQGIGFMDYDVDSYVDKLQVIIKKKMKMYEVLSRKVGNFRKYLSEEDEESKKVKNINYY